MPESPRPKPRRTSQAERLSQIDLRLAEFERLADTLLDHLALIEVSVDKMQRLARQEAPTEETRSLEPGEEFVRGLETWHQDTASPATRRRALVVEDNLVNQRVARTLLEAHGLEVEVANNGREALTYLERSRVEVILMDCDMPVLDGYGATSELRRRERMLGLARTPVIALTACITAEARLRCFESGMDDFIAKPASAETLIAKIGAWLPTAGVADAA